MLLVRVRWLFRTCVSSILSSLNLTPAKL
uniref:Uncharacterized protein n=1 Tax=Anguilla anguilla TaxID=7936 RepID=A0A0E9XD51_ANGAN